MNKELEIEYQNQVESILREYDMENATITNLELEIEYFKNLQEGYKSIDYSSESGGRTNKVNNPVERAVVQNSDKIKELQVILSEKKLIMTKLNNALEALELQERDIIESIYRKKISFKNVANQMNLSKSALSKMKKNTMKRIAQAVFL
ncbi:sigma-70 family RNA polymerase sigma factor [Clostridium ihumii]|uniref:sigma-70 family RNA polymerase sigma factor n=1 Tax=Clostridium ihumii TaxID=1470356 RepID=UPI0005531DC2|nr:sigma-70 family RNA polymerase sigma factor [Clostridium ihumii]